MAIGSLTAALLSARRPEPRLRVLLVALVGFTVWRPRRPRSPRPTGCSPWPSSRSGLTALTALTTANAMVQMRVDPAMRGRVMALYMAIFMGGTPVGAPLIGWIGERLGPALDDRHRHRRRGPRAGAVCSIWLARHENVRVSYESQRRPRVRVTTRPAVRGRARGGPVTPAFRRRVTIAVLVAVVAVALIASLVG